MQTSMPAAWPCSLFLLLPLLICLCRFCATLSLSLTIAYAGASAFANTTCEALSHSLHNYKCLSKSTGQDTHNSYSAATLLQTTNRTRNGKEKTKQRAKPIAFFLANQPPIRNLCC